MASSVASSPPINRAISSGFVEPPHGSRRSPRIHMSPRRLGAGVVEIALLLLAAREQRSHLGVAVADAFGRVLGMQPERLGGHEVAHPPSAVHSPPSPGYS